MGRYKTSSLVYGDKNDAWFVADFETVTSNTDYFDEHNDTCVLLANSLEWTNGVHHTFTIINDWWNYHISLLKSQTIWFHNLAWDGDFILKFLATQKLLPLDLNSNKKSNYVEVFKVGGKIYNIRVWLRKKVNKKDYKFQIVFRCSYRLLNSTVATLGKSVNLNKHHDDDNVLITDEKGRIRKFYDVEPKDTIEQWKNESSRSKRFLEYCKNDCEIVYRSLIEFSKAVKELSFVKNRDKDVANNEYGKPFEPLEFMTSASLTQKLMELSVKEYVYEHNMWGIYPLETTRQIHELMSCWFKGGFTQINDKFNKENESDRITNIEPSMFIDVSSAYPYQMTFSLPYGEILSSRPRGNENEDYYCFKEIKVKSAKIKQECYECPVLLNWNKLQKLIKSDERYVREMYNFTCYYTSLEWDTILKFYDVEIISEQSFFMLARPYLKQYASELYDIKNHYSKTKQNGLKQAAKILINAGYGCTAKRIDFDSKILLDGNDKEFFEKLERGDSFIFNNREYIFKFFDNYTNNGEIIEVSCASTYEKQVGANKAAAVVITSRERVYLWELILKIGCKHFCYSDTDSILFGNLTKDKYDYLIKLTSRDIVKLGDWENEYPNKKISYFAQHGAKKYMLLDENKELIKWRYAGVKIEHERAKELAEHIDFSNTEIEFEDAVLVNENYPSGRILVSKNKVIKKGKI